MICIPVTAATNAEALALLARAATEPADLHELRLDLLREEPDVHALVAAAPRRVIATVRSRAQGGGFDGTLEERAALLQRALDAGAACVDAEEDVLPLLRKTNPAAILIASWHDFAGCPEDLPAVAARLAATGADWIKFAVTPSKLSDNFRVLAAVRGSAKPAIGIAMGELGLASRVLGIAHGSKVTFGSLESGKESAPGQPTARELAEVYRVNSLTRATAVYGLVGNPVAHSAGRIFHNRAYRELGIDAVYIPFLCHNLPDFLGAAHEEINLRGLSVTMPLKQASLGLAADASATARQAGASNTLTHRDAAPGGAKAGWFADNTDYAAVAETVRERAETEGILLKDAPALVLGAGGAGRAIGAALASLGCKVTVAARNMDKARALAGAMGWETLLTSDIPHRFWRVVANSTPIGMAPNAGDTPFPTASWRAGMIAFDAVYTPRHTRFLAEARGAGAVVVDGVEMFVRQAVAQFALWTGRELPRELQSIPE